MFRWFGGGECNYSKYIPIYHNYTSSGGLQNADLIQKSLIDMYVPFLPLEKSHVKLCIREYTLRIFKQLGFGGIEIRWDGMIEWIAMQLNGL